MKGSASQSLDYRTKARHLRARAATFIVAIATLGAILVVAYGPLTCDWPQVTKSIETSETSRCWEYWVNRYQSLLGALAAIAAAVLAWRGVQGQIAEQRFATALSSHEILSKLIDETHRLLAEATKVERLSEEICNLLAVAYEQLQTMDHSSFDESEFKHRCMNAQSQAGEMVDKLRMHADLCGSDKDLSNAEFKLENELDILSFKLASIVMISMTKGIAKKIEQEPDEFKLTIDKANESEVAVRNARYAYNHALENRLTALSQRRAEIDAAALGHRRSER
jgi:hypothetical protein